MRNEKLGSQSKRSLVELAFRVDIKVANEKHIVQIGSVQHPFPDLQVLVVRIGRLVGRPADMLAETEMPRAAEADLTEPFRSLSGRAMLVVFKRWSWRREVSDFNEIR